MTHPLLSLVALLTATLCASHSSAQISAEVTTPHSSENYSKTPSNSSAPKSAPKARSVFKDILNQTPAGCHKTKTVSGARVLTSIEAWHMLEKRNAKRKHKKKRKETGERTEEATTGKYEKESRRKGCQAS